MSPTKEKNQMREPRSVVVAIVESRSTAKQVDTHALRSRDGAGVDCQKIENKNIAFPIY